MLNRRLRERGRAQGWRILRVAMATAAIGCGDSAPTDSRDASATDSEVVGDADAGFLSPDVTPDSAQAPDAFAEPDGGRLDDGGTEADEGVGSDAGDGCRVLDVDFSTSPLGPYGQAAIEADFEQNGNRLVTSGSRDFRWPTDDDGTSLHAHVVEDDGNRVLRLTLGDLGIHPNRMFMIALRDSMEAAVLRYRFRMDGSVSTPFRGAYKIPRLAGRRPGFGEYLHTDPDLDGPGGEPTTGFTTAMQFYGRQESYLDEATPFTYVYHSDQPRNASGDGQGEALYRPVPSQRVGTDRWHEMELRVRVNRRGCTDDCDGVTVILLDGEEIHRVDDWRLSDTEDLDINRFFFLAQSNRDDQRVPYVYFDDFVVECWSE